MPAWVIFQLVMHPPYALLASVVLVLFVVIHTICLLLYPLQTFKKLVTFFWLDGHTLQAVADAFIGCFKDGTTKGTSGRRFFAGLFWFFVCSLLLFTLFLLGAVLWFSGLFYLTEEGIGLAVDGLIILYRPYQNFYYIATFWTSSCTSTWASWCWFVLLLSASLTWW